MAAGLIALGVLSVAMVTSLVNLGAWVFPNGWAIASAHEAIVFGNWGTGAGTGWIPLAARGEMWWWDRWALGGPGTPWLVYAPIWFVAIPVAAVAAGSWWRLCRLRPRPGLCTNCGYDRTGIGPSARCPECGTPVR